MAIKSYVKIKPIKDDGAYSATFNQIRKGINRTGKTVTSISRNQVETEKLIRFERDWLRTKSFKEVDEDQKEEKEDLNVFQKWKKGFLGMFKFEQRNKKEDKAETKGTKGKEESPIKKKAKKAALSFLETIANFLTPIFDLVLKATLFKWLTNPEKAKRAAKVFKMLVAIGKFGFAILGFGVGNIARGISNIFGATNKTGIAKVLAPLTGFLQLLSGIATLRYLLNPLKIFSDGKKVRNLFRDTSVKELEWKKQEQWRKFGYKDAESGKIYTEAEYKAQKKSVERQQKKLRSRGQNAQADKIGQKFNARMKNPTRLQSGKNFGKQMIKPGMQKGLAIAGGITRIASGIAMGEDKTQAVGAGLGQAAGGMLGAAAGTALLGPFLGPFAPIVGNAIGGFLGEWVGKTFLPVIKPLFEPIKKYFELMWTLVQGVASETGIKEFLGTLFDFIGQIGKVMFDVIGWIMKPIGWLLGGVIKVLAGTIKFIISAAKNIFAFMTNPIGFAWKIIRGKDPGKDVKLEEMAKGGPLKLPQYFLGGLFKKKEKWEVTEEVHVEGVLRSIKWQDMNQLPKYKVTRSTILEGNTYPEFDAEQIRLGLHKGEQDAQEPGEKKEKRGWKGVLGGVADTLTGGIFDFDGKGNSPLQHLQQLPLKLAGMAAKGVIGAGKAIAGGIGKIGKGLWSGVKGLFGRKKEEIPTPTQETPAYSEQDLMRSKIEAQVLKQQEQHNALQWKKEKDATVRDVILPPRTVIMKQTNTQINTIKTGTNSRRVSTVPSPMFVC
mgnify:FL=1